MVYLDVCKGLNHIGRLGEHEHRTLRFWDSANILAMYPEATVTVLHKRPGDAQAYPVAPGYVEIQDGIVLWTIQSGDLARVGKGQVELVFHNGNTIAKSIIFDTFIDRALDGAGDPPEPWESWIDEVTDAADRAEDAAELLENPGATAETLSAGSEAIVSYSDGTFHFGIPRGQQGGKGDPGDDYVITEEDYDEIAEAVVESQGLQRIVDDATDCANIAHKLVDGKDLDGNPDDQYSENNADYYMQLTKAMYDDMHGEIGTAVDDWLDDHPEATTTVQDHSLTYEKLVNGTLGYATPEMYGAKGDGVADDTEAFRNAVADNSILLLVGIYKLTGTIAPSNIMIVGTASSKIVFPAIVDLFNPTGKVIFDHVNAESTYDGDISQVSAWSFCMANHNSTYQTVEAYNCNIKNFAGGFTQVGDYSAFYDNVITLREVITSAVNTFYGIHGDFKNSMSIVGNTIENGRHAIYISGGCKKIIVKNNHIINAKHGAIHIYSTVENRRAEDCIIEGNIIDQETSSCIIIAGYSNNLKIQNNVLNCAESYGITVEGANKDSSLDVFIDSNRITALTGIYMRVAKDCYVINNTISAQRNAVFVETLSQFVYITNNTISCENLLDNQNNVIALVNANDLKCCGNRIWKLPTRLYSANGNRTCGFFIENAPNVLADNFVDDYQVVSTPNQSGIYVTFKIGKILSEEVGIPNVPHNQGDMYLYQAAGDVIIARCTTAGTPGSFTNLCMTDYCTDAETTALISQIFGS